MSQSQMEAARWSQTLRLRSGRQIGYAEHGDLQGRPVFLFAGAPNSRLLHHPDESIARDLGAHIFTFDRPGFGLSVFQPGRGLLDWPPVVGEIADLLHIERFALCGNSAGGPYVLACAAKIPERLSTVLVTSGVGPTDVPGALDGAMRTRRIGAAIARYAPWLLTPVLWLTNNPHRTDPEQFFEKFTHDNAAADQAILAQPAMRQMMIRHYAEAGRQSIRGFAWEMRILMKAWGFRLQDIQKDVHLWHGDMDNSTPLAMAKVIADALPRCETRWFPGEAHFLLFSHWREALELLLSC